MATSSIPAGIDYLVAGIRALPECQPPVVVSDGFPAARGNDGVAIGVTPEDEDITGPAVHAQLGAQLEYEEVAVPCLLWSWRAAGTADESAKAARDAAFSIFNAIITKIRVDRTLGGAARSGAALVTGMRGAQTSDPKEAGFGRGFEIRFVVQWKNRF